MDWSLTNPPSWFPDAVATDKGWVDPATGELLVAIRGLNVKNAGPIVQRVTRVGSTTKYGRSSVISFRVKFNEVVTVTGTPRIPLTIGADSSKFLSYASGSGTSSLTFSYTVGTTESGAVSLASPIDLNSGTIIDSLSTAVVLTFTPPDTTGVTVDTTLPTTTSCANLSPSAYITGDVMNFVVTFSEAVEVVGTPRLAIDVNGTNRFANYASGSGTTTLTFRYTVVAGDTANATEFTMDSQDIDLNSGTIKDLAGNAPTDLTFTGPTTTGLTLNSTTAPVISSVTNLSGNGPFSAALESVLQFRVNWSKIVDVTGSPRMTLDINGTPKNATYVSGSGTTQTVFSYTVVAGDGATAGTFALSDPLVLNGGTIKDVFGTNATLTYSEPDTSGVVIDNTAPTAPTVAFVNGTGNYKAGTVFQFTATYGDATVAVVGSPRLPFTINGVQRYALFTAVASGVLTFEYTVVTGDSATSGQILVTSPIDLNGGTIKDAAANNAVVTFTPPSMSGVVIDNALPTITTMALGSGPNFKAGDTLTFTATMSEAVNITGTPRLLLVVNGVSRYANYASGTGTSSLTFTYAVQGSDNAYLAGSSSLASPLQLNGGAIADLAGNAMTNLAFTLPDMSAVRIDGAAPAASTVTISGHGGDSIFVTGDVLTLTATFAEPVAVTGTPRIAVTGMTAGTRQATYASGTGTTALVFNYTIVSGDTGTAAGAVGVTSPIDLNSGTIKDLAGNNATLTFAAPAGVASIIVDNGTAPTAPTVVISGDTANAYVTDDVLTLTATFNEKVIVTGTPRIAVVIGVNTRQATYASGSGSTALVFTYTVVAGDAAIAGQVSATSPIDLNSGTIKDVAANDATLTFAAPTGIASKTVN